MNKTLSRNKMRLGICLLAIGLAPLPAIAKDTFTFAVVPQQSAKTLAKTWGPLLDEIALVSGKKLVFTTAKDIPTFEQNLADGLYDFAYMNPYHYVDFSQAPGYDAIVRQKDKQIQGIIVTKKDAAVTRLSELDGSELAFPAPAAFAATIIPQAHLTTLSVSYSPKYVSSHDSVYLNVARGFAVAGGGIMRTLNAAPQEIQDQLNIVWKSDLYSPHAIAAHPGLSDEVKLKVQHAFITIDSSDEARKLLEGINFSGFEIAHNEQWNDVRALNIPDRIKRDK